MPSPLTLLGFLVLLELAACNIYPPIPVPSPEPGTLYQEGGTPGQTDVVLEIFVDLICPDSAWAWEVMKNVSQHYGQSLALVIHQFILPYHSNAYMITQGFFLIEDNLSYDSALAYMEESFSRNSDFSDSNTADMTTWQIFDMVADMAVESTGIDKDFFMQNLWDYQGQTVRAWKYGATRKAAGTPWFFVNGVDLTVNSGIRLTYDEWIEFLDPLVGNSK